MAEKPVTVWTDDLYRNWMEEWIEEGFLLMDRYLAGQARWQDYLARRGE